MHPLTTERINYNTVIEYLKQNLQNIIIYFDFNGYSYEVALTLIREIFLSVEYKNELMYINYRR